MTMPIELVLVRHGESEGNLANAKSKKDDHSAFTEEFKNRHSSTWRLTDKGRRQAVQAGQWLKKNVSPFFDRYYTSEYIRALETAVHLGFEDAEYYRDFYLRERDWGKLDVMSHKERIEKYGDEFLRRDRDGFYWSPPGGESMARLCLRIDRIIDTLHRECADKKVVIVCHGEVMWAFRVRIERLTHAQYCQYDESKSPFDKIFNCQVIHYTRRNPVSKELMPKLHWMKSCCPSDLKLSKNEWTYFKRPMQTNVELLKEVNRIPIMINNE